MQASMHGNAKNLQRQHNAAYGKAEAGFMQ